MLREAIVAPLVLVMGVHAATVQVPTDQPTIQAGIDAAAVGLLDANPDFQTASRATQS